MRTWLLLWIVLLGGCARTPDEAALREAVAALAADLEGRHAEAVFDAVAEDFVGEGGMDKLQLKRMVLAQFLRNAQIGATPGPLTIILQGDRATVEFPLLLTGGAGGWLPERGRAYSLRTGWRIEDGRWVVFSAEWEDQP